MYIYNCIYMYMYIYMCVCSHLISPCCSPCWWVFLRFSISSPGDFISFPHLFDHFIKRIWSVIQIYLISLSQKTCFPPISSFCCLVHQLSQVFPIYFSSWSLQFVFSSPKCSQPIGACYHWVSSVFPPIYWAYHDVSSVLVVRSFIVSLDFISFPHQSLHCTVHFHQFSPTYLFFYH